MNAILKIMKSASDAELIMSRKNCHGPDIASIVLNKRIDGRLVRCFLVGREHCWHDNLDSFGFFALGVHDHRYDIRLMQVSGHPYNAVFRTGLGEQRVTRYRFSSKLDGGVGATHLGAEHLWPESVSLIDYTVMRSDQLHTVYVPRGEKASWIVEEGPQVKDVTTLFNNRAPKTDDLYESFESAQEVRDYVEAFFDD